MLCCDQMIRVVIMTGQLFSNFPPPIATNGNEIPCTGSTIKMSINVIWGSTEYEYGLWVLLSCTVFIMPVTQAFSGCYACQDMSVEQLHQQNIFHQHIGGVPPAYLSWLGYSASVMRLLKNPIASQRELLEYRIALSVLVNL